MTSILKAIDRHELPGNLPNASDEELLALSEFAAWADRHKAIFATGRQRGIVFGTTPEVIDFIRRSLPDHTSSEQITQNLIPLETERTQA